MNIEPIRSVCGGVIVIMLACVVAIGTRPVAGGMGVGVDVAEIEIDEVLTPGNVYHLPTVAVINTGDQTASYEVGITYLNNQQELMPSADWFEFDPQSFPLEPGTSKRVAPDLHLPRDAPPGDYFALIEAHPVIESSGGATIAIAVATKLRFSVKKISRAVSVLDAIGDFFRNTAPYCYIILGLVAAVIVVLLSRRFFRFRLKLERR